MTDKQAEVFMERPISDIVMLPVRYRSWKTQQIRRGHVTGIVHLYGDGPGFTLRVIEHGMYHSEDVQSGNILEIIGLAEESEAEG